jgi:hypothetical protein
MVAAASCAALAVPAQAATPAERQYVAMLRTTYVPLRAAWVRTTAPCQREAWELCAPAPARPTRLHASC